MMELANNTALETVLEQAQDPKEAAKEFIREVNKGLADLMGKALESTLKNAVSEAKNPKIAGFQEHIRGFNARLEWQSVGELEQVVSVYQNAGPHTNSISVTIGVSAIF